MSKLYLIRHGQASLGSSNYDQLSDTGIKQAQWLGEHFRNLNCAPMHLIMGDMKRHQQTAENLCIGLNMDIEPEVDTGWNEFDFQRVLKAYLQQFPEQAPKENTTKAFFGVLRKALLAWSNKELNGTLPETWSDFEARVLAALSSAQSISSNASDMKNDTIFIVSSGGAIAMALKHLLGFDNESLINLNLQSRNTGVSECYFNSSQCYVTSFNTIPHLEQNGKHEFITSA